MVEIFRNIKKYLKKDFKYLNNSKFKNTTTSLVEDPNLDHEMVDNDIVENILSKIPEFSENEKFRLVLYIDSKSNRYHISFFVDELDILLKWYVNDKIILIIDSIEIECNNSHKILEKIFPFFEKETEEYYKNIEISKKLITNSIRRKLDLPL